MSVSIISNSYLDETSSKIRSKPVPWEGYQRAGLLTQEELGLIKRVDRQSRAKVESILVASAQTYAQLYLNLLKKLNRVDTVQYLLVVIGDTVTDHEERLPLFTGAVETDPELPYMPLLSALEISDEFIQLKALQLIAAFLASDPANISQEILTSVLNLIANLIQSSSPNKLDIAVQCLELLLTRSEVRLAAWKKTEILSGLTDILKSNPNPQMTYQIGFCLWLMSFETKYDIIPILTNVAQSAIKVKVIRIIIATLRNLVFKAPSQNLPAMFVAKLLPFIVNLLGRKWSDDEILEDLQYLRDELTAHFQNLTTYDEYISELTSGHLSWSPVHTSDAFWNENAMRLNEKDYEHLKSLIRLLKESDDSLVLAVAAQDIGQYVKHYDRGKRVMPRIIDDLGAKRRVMELMTHTNPDVRYQALISVQYLVSAPWKK
ncbi:hypothetical protein Clacol_006752 [Clathrus columnatus]|uniref:V-type proton ATPase subunit H n=1 Tax=Clathrus columnatus TaxID=1419009 RepID=A0AAV5ACY3_9AGAM|nr:hypothetical protein Clacol_006752 [Clathrus columnatus]